MTPAFTLEPRTHGHEHEVVDGRLHEVVQFHHCHHECFHPQRITGWLAAWLNPEAGAWLVGLREKVAALRYLEWGRYWCSGLVAGGMWG